MAKLKALIDELRAKTDQQALVFKEAGDDMDMALVKSIEGDGVQTSEEKVGFIRDLDAEIQDLTVQVRDLAELEKSRDGAGQLKTVLGLLDQPANMLPQLAGLNPDGPIEAKSFGDMFMEAWSPDQKGQTIEFPDYHVKALFQTSAGWAPETTRTGLVVPFATRPIQVVDIIPQTTTAQAAVVYMEETTYTNAAAEVAEAGAYPESAYELTQKISPVEKIAHFVPVTDEQLEDVEQAAGYLDNRLRFGLEQRLDLETVVGDGISPNLLGFLNRPGIQTQAVGGDPVPDAIYKAMVKVMVTGQAIPGAVIMNPLDWQDIRLLRTADGIYIWGSPSEVGAATIWGIPVVQAQVMTENTALVGDFQNFTELAIRRGVEVKVSDSHADYFVNGKQAIRADMRAALQVYRPAALCQVTGV